MYNYSIEKHIKINKFTYLPQIDLLKGIAIVSVLVLHSVPIYLLQKSFHKWHVEQAVPVFLVLLSYNQGRSLALRGSLFNYRYINKKIFRIYLPFTLAICVSVLTGIFYYLLTGNTILRLNRYLLTGRLPIAGPGNYFISLLIQTSLLWPFLYKAYIKNKSLFLLSTIGLNLFFDVLVILSLPKVPVLLELSVLRYITPISLGFILLEDKKNVLQRFLVLFGLLLNCIYLLFLREQFHIVLNSVSFFIAYYYVLIGIRYFSKIHNFIVNSLISVGKLSYEIFLMQIIYFAIQPFKNIRLSNSSETVVVQLTLDILFCIIAGWFFRKLNNKIVEKIKY